MNRHTTAISALIVAALLFSCGQSLTEKSLEYGDNLKQAIEKFENDRQQFAEEVSNAVETTSEDLKEENPDLPKVATDWEEEWNNIQSEFSDLEESFSLVGNSSQAYFDQLEELSAGINDEKIKNSELNKNRELKDKWTKAYLDASENIQKIREVLKEGNDFHRVLVASSIRQKIEANIHELNLISQRAKTLMIELEKFTIEGKKLIS